MNERQTKEYWNNRAKLGGSPQDLVFASTNFNEFDKNTRQLLSQYKNLKVLDVGCGYGRLSDMFEIYTGIDFSDEMIKLAMEKYPGKDFRVAETVSGSFDVVFEVMCLSSLGCTEQEFADRHNAPIIICCEPHKFTIFFK